MPMIHPQRLRMPRRIGSFVLIPMTSAELLYLLKYDKDYKFGFKDELEQSDLIQWLFFWHGSGAPYQGNLGYFRRAAEQSPCEPREYLAGNGKGKYTVADIGTWAWVKNWERSGYTKEDMQEFPHLLQWIERIAERPAVKVGTGEKYANK
ncbi:hypothetical protein DH86_00002105 [Scytalidium sp. 3C]|nr:hypothetical protein DH86_00002105 [Scytalidium sp. 3C]